MEVTARVVASAGLLWAVIALAVQVLTARGGGRSDFSRPAGRPLRGVFYNFTVAMTPAHKESISRHPVKFTVGLLMHLGVLLSLLVVVLLIVGPSAGAMLWKLVWPVAALALLMGTYLFIRRWSSRTLRAMSAPDDYVANLATCGLLALVAVYPLSGAEPIPLLLYAGALLLYLPLGKLRHAVFFFAARGNYGCRLGYRGVYPPAAVKVE